jgi:hypothetical protein
MVDHGTFSLQQVTTLPTATAVTNCMVWDLIRKLTVSFSVKSLFYGPSTCKLVKKYSKARRFNLYSTELYLHV